MARCPNFYSEHTKPNCAFFSRFFLIITDFWEALISKHSVWFECFLTSHFGLIHYFIYVFMVFKKRLAYWFIIKKQSVTSNNGIYN